MGDGKEFVGVAGVGATVGDKRHAAAALGGGVANCHKAARDAFILNIPSNAFMLDNVDHLHDQPVFTFLAVTDWRHFTACEVLHHLAHRPANAGGIDADMRNVVAGHVFLDAANLVFKGEAVPGFDMQHPERLPVHLWRRDQNKRGRITRAGGVVTGPHLTVTKGPHGVNVVIFPSADVGKTFFQLFKFEYTIAGVDKLTHGRRLPWAGKCSMRWLISVM